MIGMRVASKRPREQACTHSLNYRAPETAKAMRGFAFGLHYMSGERTAGQAGSLIASG